MKTTNPIETVKRTLFDDDLVNQFDYRIIQGNRDFEKLSGVKLHPLSGKCLMSCQLLKEFPEYGNFHIYHIRPFIFPIRKGNKIIKDECQHFFLKHEFTNEIIDLTKDQFGDFPVPYYLGRKVKNLVKKSDGNGYMVFFELN